MSTATATPTDAPAAPERAGRPAYKVTAARVLRSEWAKFWSLRSSWITLTLALFFVLAFGLIRAWRFKANLDSGQHMDPDMLGANAVSLTLFGLNFGQLALGVLGVLVAAGEYSTGMIRSTLASVPRRLPVLWAKAVVFGLVALVVGTVGAFVAFGVGSGIVSGTHAALTFSDAGVLRSLFMAGLYLALIGVCGVALGALLRSVAGGIAILVGILMLVPGLVSLLPTSWQNNVSQYLPSHAGDSMYALHHDAHTLTPGVGLLVLALWTALALAGAAYRLKRTDA
ncbi:ABC-2 type transport system permease protein [Kitasatospora sp. MAA4]|uniref:ABC transporter permease n=1 Tax=Kitasatospora sp. MAA4 TaxID=3035093 RepID=UPI00247484DE|nr:ABC transporter permease [Kitasatospora sp. MAA4]MDH6133271.1 ABC-2 type transport system permease protein [Kitasatospora sp. MAA4]